MEEDPSTAGPPPETAEQARLRPVRLVLGAALAVLAFTTLVELVRAGGDVFAVVQAIALALIIGAGVAELIIVRRIGEARRARDAGLTRILQRLSRSISSEAIVEAIVDDLRRTANVDHVVVARQRSSDGNLETTLVSGGADRPVSRTIISRDALDPAAADGRGRGTLLRPVRTEQLAADEIARRVRATYGLSATLAEPLLVDERVVGAIILSRRVAGEWPAADRRMLSWAAQELSAALARAYRLEAAEALATIDALTGLPNRRYLEEMVAVVGPRRRAGDSIGVLMIDIDHFKRLNDRFGHATGDDVLRAVGQRISAAVRASDTPARYGGEEFAVVLRRANADQALEVAERIRQMIGAIPPAEMGVSDPISVSVGVAVSEAAEIDVTNLLQEADRALYSAKREGRNRVVLAR